MHQWPWSFVKCDLKQKCSIIGIFVGIEIGIEINTLGKQLELNFSVSLNMQCTKYSTWETLEEVSSRFTRRILARSKISVYIRISSYFEYSRLYRFTFLDFRVFQNLELFSHLYVIQMSHSFTLMQAFNCNLLNKRWPCFETAIKLTIVNSFETNCLNITENYNIFKF